MQTDSERLAAIRAREAAATRGPWVWNLNLKSKCVQLEAVIRGFETVMDFVRWGLGGAVPRFKVETRPECGVMHPCHEMAQEVKGREHHASWFQTIKHPDADFLAASRADIPWLLAQLAARDAEIARMREEHE